MFPFYKQVSPTYRQINRDVTGSFQSRFQSLICVQLKVHHDTTDTRHALERSAAMATRQWASLHHIQRARHLHAWTLWPVQHHTPADDAMHCHVWLAEQAEAGVVNYWEITSTNSDQQVASWVPNFQKFGARHWWHRAGGLYSVAGNHHRGYGIQLVSFYVNLSTP